MKIFLLLNKFCFFLILGALLFNPFLEVYASNLYQAAHVIGQTSNGLPSFTSNSQNNNSDTNAQGLNYPYDLTLDTKDHRLFIADCSNNRIVVHNLDSSNRPIDLTADNVLGQSDFVSSDSSEVTASKMSCPQGVVYNEKNNYLIVSDTGNHRVLIFDLSQGITNGMAASYVLGQSDFTSNTSGTTAHKMYYQWGISYDSIRDYLFVNERNNNRVLIFDLSQGITNGMAASYVLGQSDFTSSESGLSDTKFSYNPSSFYDETLGRLFVIDSSANRVLIFDLSQGITNGMAASSVLGYSDITLGNNMYCQMEVSSNNLCVPLGVTYDKVRKNLFVIDAYNRRVLIYDLSQGITNGMAASSVLGQPDFVSNGHTWGVSTRDRYYGSEIGAFIDTVNNRFWMTANSENRVLGWDFVKIIETSLTTGTINTVYNQSLTSTQSQGTVTWSTLSGSLPPGLNMSSSGEISGTPTESGVYTFTVKATDVYSETQTFFDIREFSIVINPEPPVYIEEPVPTSKRSVSSASSRITNLIAQGNLTTALQIASEYPFAVLPNVFNCSSTNTCASQVAHKAPILRTPTLGMKGKDIKALQVFLNTHGYNIASTGPGSRGNETDFFGPLTQTAWQRYQAEEGVSTSTTKAPSSVSSPFIRNLELGSKGADVKALQVFLNTHGYNIASTGPGSRGHETDFFGNFTKTALIKFQKDKDIIPSMGNFGPATQEVIKEMSQ